MDCQTGAFRHALSISFQKITYRTIFKKKKKWGKRKLIKLVFFKVMHSSLKLGAFGYALSPLSRTSKNHSIIFKKKKRKILFENKGSSCIKFSNQGHLAMPHSGKYKSHQKWVDKFKLFTTRLHQVNSKLVSSKVSTRLEAIQR